MTVRLSDARLLRRDALLTGLHLAAGKARRRRRIRAAMAARFRLLGSPTRGRSR